MLVSSFWYQPSSVSCLGPFSHRTLQAAKDVAASRDTLLDIFGRIEGFFQRLETYIEMPTTDAMRDIIIKIMVEVLGIFGAVTKEIKQNLASTSIP